MIHDSAITTYKNPERAPWALGSVLSNFVLNTDPRLADARYPLTHSHVIGDVAGLQAALDAKAAAAHTHALSDLTQSGAATNDVATWNGAAWVPAAGGAGVSDGDKGDITVSGGGATWTIDNAAVTDAQLRDSAALSVLGRSVNSAGVVADIPVASGFFDALLTYRLGTDVVEWGYLGAGVVKIDAAFGLASSLVITADILDANVTYAKLQDVSAASRLLGRGSAAGAGVPEEITLGTNLAMAGTVLNATAGAGSSNSVTSTLAFGGSFTDSAQTVVTGQAWVAADSEIVAQVKTPSGVDPDEMRLLDFKAVISDLVAATGFTITLFSEPEAKGDYDVMCVGV